MPYGLTYKMQFKNANFENKLCTVNIHDTLAPTMSGIPYNIAFTFLGEFSGNFLREFTFDPLPVGTLGIRISFYYDLFGVETSQSEEFGPTSPVTTTTLAWMYIKKIIFEVKDAGGVYSEVIDLMAASVAIAQVIPIQGGGNPFDITVIDNDEDKYKAIRGKQATIRFISTSTVNLSTFGGTNSFDRRYYIEADVEGRFIFKGYLILDDSSELFLSPRNEVTLTASDGLGRLKDEALTDFDNANPRGSFTIGRLIAYALRKTGLSLPINVVNNIKEESSAPFLTDIVFQTGASFIAPLSAMYKIGRRIRITNAVNVTNRINDTIVTTTLLTSGPYAGQMEISFNGITTITVAETLIDARVEDVDSHLYNRILLNAKTFEAEINTSVDSYQALETMLGESCFVTQEKGEWWIYRIDELARQDAAIVNLYDENGTWVAKNDPIAYNKLVKRTTPIYFSEKQTQVTLARPYKFIKHTFRYDFPRELVCNIDFARGAGDVPDFNNADQTIDKTLECWQFLREGSPSTGANLDNAPSAGSIGVLRMKYEYGYEKSRYLVTELASGFRHYFKSDGIRVKQIDKIDINVDWRLDNDEAVTNVDMVHVRLIADDGTIWDWALDGPSGAQSWVQKLNTEVVFNANWSDDVSGEDTTEWRTIGSESKPIPRTGTLYIRLVVMNATYQVWFSNLQINYTPFVNGSYHKYKGHYFKITQTANAEKYSPIREKTIGIGDAPDVKTKGAMLLADGSNYFLAGRFFDETLWPDFVPFTEYQPYGQIIAYDVFNQYNREFRTFRASLQGLTSDAQDAQGRADLPGLTHRYQFGDQSQHTLNKRFQMIAFDQNMSKCGWTGTAKEVFDSGIDKVLTGLEFKYLDA
jgi:hypothetical protein